MANLVWSAKDLDFTPEHSKDEYVEVLNLLKNYAELNGSPRETVVKPGVVILTARTLNLVVTSVLEKLVFTLLFTRQNMIKKKLMMNRIP